MSEPTEDFDADINNFATRCFRDVADQDYLAARLAYRFQLYPQFLWSALQSIEKYFKAILLYNRVPAKNTLHNLEAALQLIRKQVPFEVRLTAPTLRFIEYLDTYGRFRYLETSYHIHGMVLPELDRAVWEIRRYCKAIREVMKLDDGTEFDWAEYELKVIEQSEQRSPHLFRLSGGVLEKILGKPKHPARSILVWRNLFYGARNRQRVPMRRHFQATNSPLALDPEILDAVLKYVFLPRAVVVAFREEQKRR